MSNACSNEYSVTCSPEYLAENFSEKTLNVGDLVDLKGIRHDLNYEHELSHFSSRLCVGEKETLPQAYQQFEFHGARINRIELIFGSPSCCLSSCYKSVNVKSFLENEMKAVAIVLGIQCNC